LARPLLASEIRDGDRVLVDTAGTFGESGFSGAEFGAQAGPAGLTVRRLEPGEIVEGIDTGAGSARDGSDGSGGSGAGSDLSALPGW
jgi:hypothetical protein